MSIYSHLLPQEFHLIDYLDQERISAIFVFAIIISLTLIISNIRLFQQILYFQMKLNSYLHLLLCFFHIMIFMQSKPYLYLEENLHKIHPFIIIHHYYHDVLANIIFHGMVLNYIFYFEIFYLFMGSLLIF